MAGNLLGRKVAVLATDGVEQVELTAPWQALKEAQAEVTLVSLKPGDIQGFIHQEKADTFHVDKIAKDVTCLLYTSDAADERSSVDLGGRRIIKKKKKKSNT